MVNAIPLVQLYPSILHADSSFRKLGVEEVEEHIDHQKAGSNKVTTTTTPLRMVRPRACDEHVD